jgi:3D (Asp-Asp-Asp) domain-containing protein
MKHRQLTLFLITLALLNIKGIPQNKNILGATTKAKEIDITEHKIKMDTETAFDQYEDIIYEPIAYDTQYVDDDETEYGTEKTLEEGINGTKTKTYLVTHWLGDELDRQLINTEIENPKNELIARGTKIVWKELATPDQGTIKYWGKLRVFATKYDSTCLGCNNTTALGAPVQEGVCAVDPKVIKMYTHFYVPGYGKCQALDVGGLIKGNRIDLAFKDHRTSPWGAEYVDIYLMDNTPQTD